MLTNFKLGYLKIIISFLLLENLWSYFLPFSTEKLNPHSISLTNPILPSFLSKVIFLPRSIEWLHWGAGKEKDKKEVMPSWWKERRRRDRERKSEGEETRKPGGGRLPLVLFWFLCWTLASILTPSTLFHSFNVFSHKSLPFLYVNTLIHIVWIFFRTPDRSIWLIKGWKKWGVIAPIMLTVKGDLFLVCKTELCIFP